MKLNALVILAVCASFAASATEPASAPAPAATPAPAAPAAAATAASPATAATPAATPAAAVDLASDNLSPERRASAIKWARNHGYKPTQKAHGTWWCKSEVPLGSRLAPPKADCASEESLVEMEKASIATKENLGEKMRSCGGQNCFSN